MDDRGDPWGTLTETWVPHDVRDLVVDFVRRWSEKTEISAGRFISWLGVTASKFYNWRQRDGRVNEHNGWVPRDFWLEAWEKEASSVSMGRIHCKVIGDVRERAAPSFR